MKICFSIACIDNCGGTERVSSIIMNNMCHKHNVSVLSFEQIEGRPFFELDNSINVKYLFENKLDCRKNYIKIVKKLYDFLKREKFDVLIMVEVTQIIFVKVAAIPLNVKLIAWEHFNFYCSEKSKLAKISRKMCAKYCDFLITLTEEDKRAYMNHLVPKAEVVHIYNPLIIGNDNQDFVGNKENIILSIGRLEYQKGYDILLRISKLVFEDEISELWKWVIIGDGTEKAKLIEKAKELKVEKYVSFIGEIRDVTCYLKKAQFLVMTSRYEGFALVIVEAQQYNLPVISFDCKSGPKELIKDGINGYLIPCFDEHGMAEKIKGLMLDPKLRQCFAQNAKIKHDELEIEKILRKWEEILNRCKRGENIS